MPLPFTSRPVSIVDLVPSGRPPQIVSVSYYKGQRKNHSPNIFSPQIHDEDSFLF